VNIKKLFPLRTSVKEAVEIIEQALKNHKILNFDKNNTKEKVSAIITNMVNDKFAIHITQGIARFYPMAPK
jgi:hypothetical protein